MSAKPLNDMSLNGACMTLAAGAANDSCSNLRKVASRTLIFAACAEARGPWFRET
jgi:hypothetical protein